MFDNHFQLTQYFENNLFYLEATGDNLFFKFIEEFTKISFY